MTTPWFTLKLRDDAVRKMTREQYYAHRRFLRITQRMVHEHMTRHAERIGQQLNELVVYGTSPAMAAMADIRKLEVIRDEYPEEHAEALRQFGAEQGWF